jgi:hypothetical protein
MIFIYPTQDTPVHSDVHEISSERGANGPART